LKELCINNPEKKLLLTTTKGKSEILEILNHIKGLRYEDRPNYYLIRKKLEDMLSAELLKFNNIRNITSPQSIPDKAKEINFNFYDISNNILNNTSNQFLGMHNSMNSIIDNLNKQMVYNLLNTNNMFNPNYGLTNHNPMQYDNYNFNEYLQTFNKMMILNNQQQNANLLDRKMQREEEIPDINKPNEMCNPFNYYVENNMLLNPMKLNTQQQYSQFPNINTLGHANQQNQIFIINQFDKSKITDFEKTLIDLINPNQIVPNVNITRQVIQNPIINISNEEKKPTNVHMNDKLLINNIKDKLKQKQNEPKQKKTPRIKNHKPKKVSTKQKSLQIFNIEKIMKL
jgi:hypothetical protein